MQIAPNDCTKSERYNNSLSYMTSNIATVPCVRRQKRDLVPSFKFLAVYRTGAFKYFTFIIAMVHILESGISLVHPYSRNKFDE